MRGRLLLVALALLLGGVALQAHEWRPHNRMAFYGGDRASASDQELGKFLKTYGEKYLYTRAGNPCDPQEAGCPSVDEDYTEGRLGWFSDDNGIAQCAYVESYCSIFCSMDHFEPPLDAPFGGVPATEHAAQYFDWAVRLYKASKCPGPMAEMYRIWAAKALGHAIHLVEDMGSPQHVKPENHAPIVGHGRSFLERWAIELWDTKAMWIDPGGGSHHDEEQRREP